MPEQNNLSAEQNLFRYLNIKSLFNVEVLTLSRMATRLLEEFGKEDKSHLSQSRKSNDYF